MIMNSKKEILLPLLIILLMFTSTHPVSNLEPVFEPLETTGRSSVCTGDVCLSELLVNAIGGSETGAVSAANWAGAEWVEIYNSGSSTVSVNGWILSDNYNRDMVLDISRVVWPENAVDLDVAAGGYIVVARNGDGGNCGFCMTNDGAFQERSVTLINGAGASQHTATWNYYTTEGATLIENPLDPNVDWQEADQMTPGADNGNVSLPEIEACLDICINEIYPNPIGDDAKDWPDGEWIELYNNGSTAINLSGWGMVLNSGDHITNLLDLALDFNSSVEEDWMLQPAEYLLLPIDAADGFSMGNTGDNLSLIRPNSTIGHYILWAVAPSGISMVAPPASIYWIRPPYATPGWENPINLQDSVNGSSDLKLNEVMAYPDTGLGDVYPGNEWVELQNTGDQPIALEGWTLRDGGFQALPLADFVVSGANTTTGSLFADPGEYVVVGNLDPGLGVHNRYEVMWLIDPSGVIVQAIHWNTSTMGFGLIPDVNGTVADPWVSFMATPGAENVEPPPDYDEDADFRIVRIMPEESAANSRGSEYIEIRNLGDASASMLGWRLNISESDGTESSAVFSAVNIAAGSSAFFTSDADDLTADAGLSGYAFSTVSSPTITLPDAGAAVMLVNPFGVMIDTVVYGAGPSPVAGWSGASIQEPNTDSVGLVLLRGDGCDQLPDTNTSADWEHSWSRLGRSLFCGGGDFDVMNINVTPMIGPDDALYQMIDWIGGAQTSLHVHMYEFTSWRLALALVQAAQRGVDVTLVIEKYPYSTFDFSLTRGLVSEMHLAEVTVLWFTAGDAYAPAPYTYNHAKAAVRDDSSIWVGTGNFKDSSFPHRQQYDFAGETVLYGTDANRDLGLFIDSPNAAQVLLERMAWDENTDRPHISAYSPSEVGYDEPADWSGLSTNQAPSDAPLYSIPTFDGAISAKLVSCPEDCAAAIIDAIDAAQSSVRLSVQYLDLDWYYGWSEETSPWGESLVVGALQSAAARGVEVRLIINAYYVDDSPEVQHATYLFNEYWNQTLGYDSAAVMMSSGDGISKSHNKEAIFDDQTVLIGSMNWGSSALLRNREYGVMLNDSALAAYYVESWQQDWDRLDDWTDTDGDNLPDWWEVAFGLNRTSSLVPGTAISEHSNDPDSDGLNNLQEYQYGGDPLAFDTDGDCIDDGDEVAFAQSMGLSTREALTNTDADEDGVDDGVQTNCGEDLEDVIIVEPTDSDLDGVIDGNDLCPGTLEGVAVRTDGCPVDSDGDGVDDLDPGGAALDLCPNTPIGVSVDPSGCELSDADDVDGDGIEDALDDCANTPTGLSVDDNGCSDADGDAIIDPLDDCAGTPPGSIVNSRGCTESQQSATENEVDTLPNGAAADDTTSLLLLGLMITSLVAFAGALVLFMFQRRRGVGGEVFADLTSESVSAATLGLEDPKSDAHDEHFAAADEFTSPVLDAVSGMTSSEAPERQAVFAAPVLAHEPEAPEPASEEEIELPGWTQDVIDAYLAQGWTMHQLKEWYDENI